MGVKIFADLHLHSKYSRATSKNMDIEHMSLGALRKGLNLLGTGDFTHELWLKELESSLREFSSGIYESRYGVKFLLTTEVSNVYEKNGKTRKIHNVLIAKDFAVVKQVNEILSKYGDLKKDGRPTLALDCAEMVELLKTDVKDVEIIPAHIWTPWFSLFGSRSGFDSIYDCYEEQTKHILALETGLSSDPEMNWRLSELDDFALVSFSDSHSPHSHRLGREACVFELKEFTYDELVKAIKDKNPKKFLFTIEVDPSYGKYHWDGHRACGVALPPKEAEKLGNICPVCGKPLTIGVLHRVEKLADREEGFIPKNAIPFKRILPLSELIALVLGEKNVFSKKVSMLEERLISKFGNEFKILLEVSEEEMKKVIENEKLIRAILLNREGKIKILPGYDGVYGKPVLDENYEIKAKIPQRHQKSLSSFF